MNTRKVRTGMWLLLASLALAVVCLRNQIYWAAYFWDHSTSFQYYDEGLRIPFPNSSERKLVEVSIPRAVTYLENGAAAWGGNRNCVSCHTNGSYMMIRPRLTRWLGPPAAAIRDFFVWRLNTLERKPFSELTRSVARADDTYSAEVIYIAEGLAEWDANVTGTLSPETDRALRFMFRLQFDDGAWRVKRIHPPFESSDFQQATVAAMAVGTAPGWLASVKDTELLLRIEKMKKYILTQKPMHEYDRVLMLWAEQRLPGLLSADQKAALIDLVLSKQRPDGGWAMRSFAAPEEWLPNPALAIKLRAEPDFNNPQSDSHQTGLAIILLVGSGIPAEDSRIQRGVAWLKANQREPGYWFTPSLFTPKTQYITYSSTAYALLALALGGALPLTN